MAEWGGEVEIPVVNGRYATWEGMLAKFGRESLEKWGRVDGDDDSAYAAAVNAAIVMADAKVDSYLSSGTYVVPFTGSIPPLISDVANALAGIHLYENMGVTDFNAENGYPIHKYQYHAKYANTTLAQIKNGMVDLVLADGTTLQPSVNYPQAGIYET